MAQAHLRLSSAFDSGPDTPEELDPNGAAEDEALSSGTSEDAAAPSLVHRFRHDKSILCLTTGEQCIYAGTQGGDILVSMLKYYARIKRSQILPKGILVEDVGASLCVSSTQSQRAWIMPGK